MKLVLPILLLLVLTLMSCSQQLNQEKNGLRHGKWRTVSGLGDSIIERYKKGELHGLSKQYVSGHLYKTERQHRRRSKIKFYHENGKISSRGRARLDDEVKYLHWYYTGKWKYFDDAGILNEIRVYEKGLPISEKNITRKSAMFLK